MRLQATTRCSVEGCATTAVARGWCQKHYMRWWNHGHTDILPRPDFASLTNTDGLVPPHMPDIGPCREWRGTRLRSGYGQFTLPDGKRILAHRWALQQATGQDGKGLLACHRCDNPPCVRDSHLFWGTNADNLGDSAAKGRMRHGSAHYRARITEADVQVIRQLAAAGMSQRAIGARYGMHQVSIGAIVRREKWRHVA